MGPPIALKYNRSNNALTLRSEILSVRGVFIGREEVIGNNWNRWNTLLTLLTDFTFIMDYDDKFLDSVLHSLCLHFTWEPQKPNKPFK